MEEAKSTTILNRGRCCEGLKERVFTGTYVYVLSEYMGVACVYTYKEHANTFI